MRLLYTTRVLRKITLIVENLFFNLMYQKKLGNKVTIFGFPIITYKKHPNFKFGKNIRLISSMYFSPMGVSHPVIIRLLNEKAELKIGNDVGLNGAVINVMEKVSIGDNVLIGNNVFISDTDHHPVDPKNRRYSKANIKSKPITIEDNVFIGKDALILKGVKIGENSIVGAGSVVFKDIPENEIWAGNPAKHIKSI